MMAVHLHHFLQGLTWQPNAFSVPVVRLDVVVAAHATPQPRTAFSSTCDNVNDTAPVIKSNLALRWRPHLFSIHIGPELCQLIPAAIMSSMSIKCSLARTFQGMKPSVITYQDNGPKDSGRPRKCTGVWGLIQHYCRHQEFMSALHFHPILESNNSKKRRK